MADRSSKGKLYIPGAAGDRVVREEKRKELVEAVEFDLERDNN
jgi:hypothetical protein